jgi:polyribonucleotide nucleotidyltransferase
MFNEIIKKIEWNGATLELSTGKIARQADGAVMVRMGNSAVLCTAVSAKEVKPGMDFFPLTVNYQERAYAAGKIPGGFFKREGRGSEKEVLVSRLIDRPIRPLFHSGFFNETQVLCTAHSYDVEHNTDVLALIGASAALAISGVPYEDIVAACRVGLINGEFVLNPSVTALEESQLELVVAGTEESVMMVESEAALLTENQMLDAIKFGHNAIKPVIQLIKDLVKDAGKPKWATTEIFPEELKDQIRELTKNDITKAFAIKTKQERYAAIADITRFMIEKFVTDGGFTEMQVKFALSEVKSEVLRDDTLAKKVRIDGRKLDEIRPIECEISLFPNVHGSALFTRGETQGLVITTLGTGQDEQIMDSLDGEYKEPFLLNYLFPGYSVGEAQQLRAPSRREVGHGKLAWRALKRALPSKESFPYTIRVVSEITESNGSSSMATVCGASMSMMDAGVPLKAPIAGIAMGLIKEGDQFVVLSDIIADEDHLGDMDFKVAGGHDGVTALQMDIKVAGITFDIMEKALEHARAGRLHILEKMSKAISATGSLSNNAPMIISFKVNKDKIREIIGPGGKVIREICETTGAKIDITDDGNVSVSAVGKDKLDAAISRIKEIAFDPEVGDVFEGTVVKVLESGAFVNYLGSRDGFVHISEIAQERIESVSSVLSEGQKVKVKLIGFDRGKAKLTIKNADTAGDAAPKPAPKKEKVEEKSEKKVESNPPAALKESTDTQPKPEKREGAKKWKTKPAAPADDVTERKYFN